MSVWNPESAVAVVKPDHMGDFVLSIAALRALHRQIGRFDLHAAKGNQFLADAYLPSDVALRPLKLQHLSRDGAGISDEVFGERMATYDVVVALRGDVITRDVGRRLGTRLIGFREVEDAHETESQRVTVRPITGDYSRRELVWGGTGPQWPTDVRRVGISLSAGFTSNKLPAMHWIEFANLLRELGIEVSLLGGPVERSELDIVARRMGLPAESVIIGTSDLKGFQDRLAECDVIVGADSGAMHLASLTRPVLAVFTSSPWRRFAPLGPHVRVLKSNIECAPCIQFSHTHYNGCVFRECAGMIAPEHLLAALQARPEDEFANLPPELSLIVNPSGHHPTILESAAPVSRRRNLLAITRFR